MSGEVKFVHKEVDVYCNNVYELIQAQKLLEILGYRIGKFDINALPCNLSTYKLGGDLYTSRDTVQNSSGGVEKLTLDELVQFVAGSLSVQGTNFKTDAAFSLYSNGIRLQCMDLEADNLEWVDVGDTTNIGKFIDQKYTFKVFKPVDTAEYALNIPKPFKPKFGEVFWHLTISSSKGYAWSTCGSYVDYRNSAIGVWKTEEEIKIVVKELEKLKGFSCE